MSRLTDCLRATKMPAAEAREIRAAVKAAGGDEMAGLKDYLDGINDDLEDFRGQLAAKGFDLSVKGLAETEVKASQGKIEDFGEKIGGARKDTARPIGSRQTQKAEEDDDRATWAKRYTIKPIEVSGENGETVQRFQIYDERTKEALRDPTVYWKPLTLETKEQAEKILPLIAVAKKHRVTPGDGDTYKIVRDVTDRKRVTIKDGFKTRDEAMRYLHDHATEILETKTGFGEEILALKDQPERKGPERRSGDATSKMFNDAFGFRAVEFGDWNNQDERQAVMNHAYDGLMDLADVMGVPPKALSMNGDLSIAFGARGHGGKGAARAHYERNYGVMNLTKMQGAGSLAHEWFHAFDAYMGRIDSKASPRNMEAGPGKPIFETKGREDYASHGLSKNTKMRTELAAALSNVFNTIRYKTEKYVEDTAKAEEWLGKSRDQVRRALDGLRDNLAKEQQYGAKRKAATPEQLARFDALADKLVSGADINREWRMFPVKNSRLGVKGRWTTDTLEALSELNKEVRGRSGFSSEGHGPVDGIGFLLGNYAKRIALMEEARSSTEKVKLLPSEFLRESRRIDEGSVKDYWATEHEMGARAFSAYVEDKIAEQKQSSEFLSFGSDNILFRDMGIRPFPEGEERAAINGAFDNLVKTLQTRATDRGVEMFSKSREPSATFTGEEVAPRGIDIGMLRDKAYRWYRENLIGTKVTNRATGQEIEFNASGAKKTVHSRGEDLLRAVPAIPHVLEHGEVLSVEQDRTGDPNVKAWHTYGGRVEIGGKPFDMVLKVRELKDGSFHYSLNKPWPGSFSLGSKREPAETSLPALEGTPGPDINIELAPASGKDRQRMAEAGQVRQAPVEALMRVEKALQDRAQKYGISNKVSVEVVRAIFAGGGTADGRFSPAERLVQIAFGAEHNWVLDHETIHVLREWNAIKKEEWSALSAAARADTARMDKIRQDYAGLDLTEDQLVEEAIADMFADWVKGQGEPKGFTKSAFEAIRAVIRWIRESLGAAGYNTPEDFFRAVTEGKIGAREYGEGDVSGDRYSIGRDRIDPARPFFSALTRNIEGLNQNKGPAAQWAAIIDNLRTKGVKPEEVEWSGVKEWLAEQKGPVSKADLVNYLRENEVQVKEVAKSLQHDIAERLGFSPEEWNSMSWQDRKDAADTEGVKLPPLDPTKFGPDRDPALSLPGGKNYREVLLTLPEKGNENLERLSQKKSDARRDIVEAFVDEGGLRWDQAVQQAGGVWNGDPGPVNLLRQAMGTERADKLIWEVRNADEAYRRAFDDRHKGNFTQSHWSEWNVLAHLRLNDRTGPNGERILHVEEIQSDWHQRGRKDGYQKDVGELPEGWSLKENSQGNLQLFDDKGERVGTTFESKENALRWLGAQGVPDAPFKTTWHELAFKRALRFAAEEGYDKITWTTGEQQNARYDLSKRVEDVSFRRSPDGNTYQIYATPKGESGEINLGEHPSDKLGDVVGKDIADKITQHKEASGTFSGLDLKVGGEGMKGFYDKILPDFARKYVKKWGATVDKTNIGEGEPEGWYIQKPRGDFMDRGPWESESDARIVMRQAGIREADGYKPVLKGGEPQIAHSIDITPQMRESVMQGQPMFSLTRNRARASTGQFVSPKNQNHVAPKGTLEQEKAINKAIAGEDKRSIWQKLQDAYAGMKERAADEMIYAFADEFQGLRRAGKILAPASADRQLGSYVAARMARHSAGQIEAFLRHGAPEWDAAEGVLGIAKGSKGFYDIVAPLYQKGLERLWEGYAYARRVSTQDLIGQGKEHNLTHDDVDALLDLGNQYPEFKTVFDEMQAYKKATLDAAEAMGLISKDQRDIWEQADHVPFYRAVEEGNAKGPNRKRGLAGQTDGVRRLTGGGETFIVVNNKTGEIKGRYEAKGDASVAAKQAGPDFEVETAGQPIVGVIENIARNVQHLVDAAMKNHAAVMAVDEALQLGWAEKVGREMGKAIVPQEMMAKTLREAGIDVGKGADGVSAVMAIVPPKGLGKDVVQIRRNGEIEYYRVDDPLLLKGLIGLHRSAITWAKPFAWFKNLLTRTVTSAPTFMVRNFLRDSLDSWATTEGRSPNVFGELGRSIKSLRKSMNDPRVQALMAAGGDTGWYKNAPADVVTALKHLEEDGQGKLISLARPRQLLETYEAMGRAAEQANRIAVYEATLQKTGSKREAVFAAMDVLDFQLKGGGDFIQWMTAITPFLNARIQGLYRLGRVAAAPGPARKALLTKLGLMAAFSTILGVMNGGDDDYNDKPEWLKDTVWMIPVWRIYGKDVAKEQGLPKFLYIPKPFEIGLLFGTLPERAVQLAMGNDRTKETANSLIAAVANTLEMNPFGNPLLKESVEQWANKDFFSGSPIVNQTLQYLPPDQQATSGTSWTVKKIGEAFDISPVRLEHAIHGFTSDVGMTLLALSDAAARAAGIAPPAPAKSIKEAPVLRAFMDKDPERTTKWLDRFYETREAAETIMRGVNARAKSGNPEAARKLLQENKGLLASRQMLDKVGDTLSAINTRIKQVENSTTLSPGEKRLKIDALIQKRNDLAKRAEMAAEKRIH